MRSTLQRSRCWLRTWTVSGSRSVCCLRLVCCPVSCCGGTLVQLMRRSSLGMSGVLHCCLLTRLALPPQAKGEVDEHSEVLADFKAQALPLARIKKVRQQQAKL